MEALNLRYDMVLVLALALGLQESADMFAIVSPSGSPIFLLRYGTSSVVCQPVYKISLGLPHDSNGHHIALQVEDLSFGSFSSPFTTRYFF